jgi:hypothetical protein
MIFGKRREKKRMANPLPEEIIEAIPTVVQVSRESCQEAADAALLALFSLGVRLDPVPDFPLILSNGHEVWPMPAPWNYAVPYNDTGWIKIGELLDNLNGVGDDIGLLKHIKLNAQKYNEALESGAESEARAIAEQSPADSASIWNNTNALAMSLTKQIYHPLSLSAATRAAYERLEWKKGQAS